MAITPCRVADTRGNGFTGEYGPPAITGGGTQYSFDITGQCGIPTAAQAVSFNFGIWAPVTGGDLRAFPAGGGTPIVSTLNWEGNVLALARGGSSCGCEPIASLAGLAEHGQYLPEVGGVGGSRV